MAPDEPGGLLDWDKDKRKVSGFDSERILNAAIEVVEKGGISHPAAGLYTDKDPLKDEQALGILLFTLGYQFPEQLAPFCKPFRVKGMNGIEVDY